MATSFAAKLFREKVALRDEEERRGMPGKPGDFAFIKEILSDKDALTESRRCLGCFDRPCQNSCPVAMDVPGFISRISRGDTYGAAKIVFEHNPLGATCGILCPVSEFCGLACKTRDSELGHIHIGRLQQYCTQKLMEMDLKAVRPPPVVPVDVAQARIACVGAGPASLSCATYLARIGFQNITVFEKEKVIGGTVTLEIPAFRMPEAVSGGEIEFIKDLGVKFELGKTFGQDFDIKSLREDGFEGIFLSPGLMLPKKIREIDEDRFENIMTSKDFLKAVMKATKPTLTGEVATKLPELKGNVLVVGAGDVAADCSLTALRCGADSVSMVFRRGFPDMRCSKEEFENVVKEGVNLVPNSMPLRVNGDGTQGKSLTVELSQKNIKTGQYLGTGQTRELEFDTLITALGSDPDNKLWSPYFNILDINEETLELGTMPGVFVGGDATMNSASIVEAVSDGRAAALSIASRMLSKHNLPALPADLVPKFMTTKDSVNQPSTHIEVDIEDLIAEKKPETNSANDKPFSRRITTHPVVEPPLSREKIHFTFNGEIVEGYEGEVISSALIAAGHDIFGHHVKDKSPQGMFCANGQCSACEVVLDGIAVKSCMVNVREGQVVESGLPNPPIKAKASQDILDPSVIEDPMEFDVLIIGGGPSGLSAAVELGKVGVQVLLVDDKDRLGGKLVLQTHKFFGSVEDTNAGTRGMDIGKMMASDVANYSSVTIWLNTTAVGIFSDKIVGLQKFTEGKYILVRPKKLLIATGSREKMLPFKGNTIPGVYGAGAFQTLVNRDFVRPAKRILIVGGGNVGLITGYHAIQAGIEVAALIEGLPKCGGYKVHEDKLHRLGVPIFTRHTILAAHGTDFVEGATVAQIGPDWKPISGTEKEYKVDCVLVAVGLAEVNEFYGKAKKYGFDVYSAGDAQKIAEASAAIITGRIEGLKIANSLGKETDIQPEELNEKAATLRLPGGKIKERDYELPEGGIRPIIHCRQEIPCNVCTSVCPHGLITLENGVITGLPHFDKTSDLCEGCLACVSGCSGLAITLVDGRENYKNPFVTLPFEIKTTDVAVGKPVPIVGENSNLLGEFLVTNIQHNESFNTDLVTVQMPAKLALDAVGVWQQRLDISSTNEHKSDLDDLQENTYVCRCERVTATDIRNAAKMGKGSADVNQIKAITRQGMGACGGKSCGPNTSRILSGMGLGKATGVAPPTDRPLVVEMPLGQFGTAPTPFAPASLWPKHKYIDDKSKYSYDVIIIGAGSIGVPLAISLAEAGKKVVCLDSLASVGQGDNKHAIGGIRATMSHPGKIITLLDSLDIFRNWKERHGDDIEWDQGGYLFPVYREEEESALKNLLQVQKNAGLNIDWIPKEEMLAKIPGIVEEGLRGGTYSPEDGLASPMMSINAFYRHAVELGASFMFKENVQCITRDVSGKVTGVITNLKRVDNTEETKTLYASTVVVACGAHSNEILHTVGRQLPLDPDSHEAGITEPVKHMLSGMVIDLRPAPGSKNFYFYQNVHGQVVFCITPDPPIRGFDEEETSQFLPQCSKRILRLVPRLESMGVRRVWRGLYNNTPDGAPLFGWDPEIPGLFHATGMGGHGYMLGPGIGNLGARMITNCTTEQDQIPIEQFKPLREFTGGTEALK